MNHYFLVLKVLRRSFSFQTVVFFEILFLGVIAFRKICLELRLCFLLSALLPIAVSIQNLRFEFVPRVTGIVAIMEVGEVSFNLIIQNLNASLIFWLGYNDPL